MSKDEIQADAFTTVRRVLEQAGAEAHMGQTPEEAARDWLSAGFDDSDDVAAWLEARCFKPGAARALEDAGIESDQAALRTTAGSDTYEETVGYKVARGDLSLGEARRVVNIHFWHDQ